ncbi:MAG: hypothetical protein LBQ66_03620 [Planctomycetaceae bacterium]|nr:hypothetical protein [Planctomycetaceae bacterium]
MGAEHASVKPKRPKRRADWFFRCILAIPLSASTPTQPPGSRLPTLHLPNRFGVQFKLVRFYYAQRRAGRPRSSPLPLRGGLLWYNEVMVYFF